MRQSWLQQTANLMPSFMKQKTWSFMWIICWQMIHMKFQVLFGFLAKATCCRHPVSIVIAYNAFNSMLTLNCLRVSSADKLCKQFGPSHAWNVWLDLDPNCLTLWWYSRVTFFWESRFWKNQQNGVNHLLSSGLPADD